MQPPTVNSVTASALIQVCKYIPDYLGYDSKPSLQDEQKLREYLKVGWSNFRNTVQTTLATTETSSTGLREKIEQLIIEIDVVESELRTTPTGDFSKKINSLPSANKSIITDLISLDLQIIEILKEINSYEIVDSNNEEALNAKLMSLVIKFKNRFNERKAIIKGVPIEVLGAEVKKKGIGMFKILSLLLSVVAIGVTIYFNMG
ncbi:MAG: hypothetical protein ACPGAN_06980 [Candidatus Poseidoniaceae archaeon]